jgi:hypothetical protein
MTEINTLKQGQLHVTEYDSGEMKNSKSLKTISEYSSRADKFNYNTFSKKSK